MIIFWVTLPQKIPRPKLDVTTGRQSGADKMDPHKYRLGQNVRFNKNTGRVAMAVVPPGNFRVTNLLPDTQGRNQYRVESLHDGHQRVAIESEITAQ